MCDNVSEVGVAFFLFFEQSIKKKFIFKQVCAYSLFRLSHTSLCQKINKELSLCGESQRL